jgi:hypothetical protein
VGHVACIAALRNIYEILVYGPEGKRLLGKFRYILEDSIGINLKKMGWEGVG